MTVPEHFLILFHKNVMSHFTNPVLIMYTFN